MKFIKISLLISLLMLMLITLANNSCNSGKYETVEEMNLVEEDMSLFESTESENVEYDTKPESVMKFAPLSPHKNDALLFVTSQAASTINDGNKKFIRSAQLRLQVADVLMATHQIENIIIAQKGFILNSTVNQKVIWEQEYQISKDSLLIEKQVQMHANLTLRIQHTALDAVLREIAPLAEDVEYRQVNASEVTFDIIEKELEQKRNKGKASRMKQLSQNKQGSKLEDLIKAEEVLHRANEAADKAIMDEYRLQDNIVYSTIAISLKEEPKTILKTKSENKEFELGFFVKTGKGLLDGWYGLLDVVSALLTVWPLWLILGLIVYGVIYLRRKKKK